MRLVARFAVVALAAPLLAGAARPEDRDDRVRSCKALIELCTSSDPLLSVGCLHSIRSTLDTYVIIEGQAPSFCKPRHFDNEPVITDVRRQIRRTISPEAVSAPECVRAAAAKLYPCAPS